MINNKSLEKRLTYLQGTDSLRLFARKCGVPESTMRGYISGKRIIPTDIASGIADAFAIPLAWLMAGKLQPIKDIHPEKLMAIYELDPEVIDIEKEGNKIVPVVKTYDDEQYHLIFYCIHCQKIHYHGRGGPNYHQEKGRNGMAGHRVSHCVTMNSPFRNHGVILDVIDTCKNIDTQKRDGRTLSCPKCHNYYSAAFNACECGFINKSRKSKFQKMAQIFQEPFLHLPFHPSQEELNVLKELHSDNFDLLDVDPGAQTEENNKSALGLVNKDSAVTMKKDLPGHESLEPETKMVQKYRELAEMDADTLGEIQTWLNDTERLRPGFTGWFRLEFQNRFPEFAEWKRKTAKKQQCG